MCYDIQTKTRQIRKTSKKYMMDKMVINRNGIDLEFSPQELTRGENKGTVVMVPEKVTTDNVDRICTWIGKEDVAGIINGRFRTYSIGWTESAQDQQGNFVPSVFKTSAENFSARGDTIKDLKERIDDLLDLLATCTEGSVALDYAKQIKNLKNEMDSKRRPRNKEEEEKVNS